MDLFEKINRSFGGWYEGLFGGGDDVRPKDILRKILTAMEENRKEGFDSKVYVPNQYILEISVDDEEEKEYLLSFLDRDELQTAIRRYCQQNNYHVRGGLDFTIKELEPDAGSKREKVRVRCRYDSKLAAEKPEPEPVQPEPAAVVRSAPEEDATVYESAGDSDEGTVPAIATATLSVYSPGRLASEYPINRAVTTIGRSTHVGNDVILADDGMVSRRHARIELEADGRFTIYDLNTTNGTRVNGRKVDNRALSDGDEIHIGSTRIVFHQMNSVEPAVAHPRREFSSNGHKARLVMTDGDRDVDEYVLGSETVVGRAVTNDIVLPERSIATRHVRILRGEPSTVEALDPAATTLLNGSPLTANSPTPLRTGDRIGLGPVVMRFEEEAS